MLWLADNNITVIEGLEKMRNLRDLNLARNDISLVGEALSKNTALQVKQLTCRSASLVKGGWGGPCGLR